jgi:hypothetical protein
VAFVRYTFTQTVHRTTHLCRKVVIFGSVSEKIWSWFVFGVQFDPFPNPLFRRYHNSPRHTYLDFQ